MQIKRLLFKESPPKIGSIALFACIAGMAFLSSCNSTLDDLGDAANSRSSDASSGASLSGAVIPPGMPGNPSTPNTLIAKAYTSSVLLVWTPPNSKNGPYTYSVWRRPIAGGPNTKIVNAMTATNYNDTTAQNGVGYIYKIQATGSTGQTSESNEVSAQAISAFSINSVIQAPNNSVTMTWTPATGADNFDIVLGNGTGDFNQVLQTNVTSPATLTNLNVSTSYTIQVVAKNSVGLGAQVRSSTVSRIYLMLPFTFGLTAAATGMKVNWTTVAGADRYKIEWGTSPGVYTNSTMVTAPATDHVVTGLAANTQYYVMMTAYGGFNEFKASSEQNLLYGVPFTLNYPFTSGTTTDYTFTSPSSTTTFSAGGVCTLGQITHVDSSNVATGFAGGTLFGMTWNAAQSALILGNSGGCNGAASNCLDDLDPSWTPQWSNIIGYWKLNGTGTAPVNTSVLAAVGPTGVTKNPNGSATMTYSSGRIKNALSFDGVDDSITLPSTGVHTGVSFSAWVYPTSTTTLMNVVSGTGVLLYPAIFGNTFRNYDGTAWRIVSGITTSRWNHVAMTFDGTTKTMRLYVNGIKGYDSGPAVGTHINGALTMIGNLTTSGRAFSGLIDDVAVWKSVLTPAEVQAIYDRQSTEMSGHFTSRVFDAGSSTSWSSFDWLSKLPFGKPLPDGGAANSESTASYPSLASGTLMTGIRGIWHLNEPAGTTGAGSVKDASGSGLDGTPTGGTFGTAAVIGNGVSYAANGYVTVPTIPLTTAFTLSAWVKLNAHKNYNQLLMQHGGTTYYGLITDSTGKVIAQIANAGVNGNVTTVTALALNTWYHLTVTYDSALPSARLKVYINGVQDATTGNHATGVGANAAALSIGRDAVNAGRELNGSIDEVAIWARGLNAAEVLQLYRRGSNKLKFQIRTCATVNAARTDCTDGSAWMGPDGTDQTYYSELNNNTIPQTMLGAVRNTTPSIAYSDFSFAPTAQRYFQYRVIAESNHTGTGCNYGAGAVKCSPELTRVTTTPSTVTYDYNGPNLYGNTGAPFARLTSLTEVLGPAGCPAGVGYALSLDKVSWYYSNGSIWLPSDGTVAKSGSLTATNARLSSFGTQVGIGTIYIRAFLKSNGSQACELDSITLNGDL